MNRCSAFTTVENSFSVWKNSAKKCSLLWLFGAHTPLLRSVCFFAWNCQLKKCLLVENTCGKSRKQQTKPSLCQTFPPSLIFAIPQANRGCVVAKTRGFEGKLVQNSIKIHNFSTSVEKCVENSHSYVENLNFLFEFVDFCKERGVIQHFEFYQAVRRNNGGVIAAENFCNTWERHLCQFTN